MEVEHRKKSHWTDAVVDIAAVVLISATTVFSAWCGSRSSQWSATETEAYHQADAHRIQAAQFQNIANFRKNADLDLYLQYLIARDEGHPTVRNYISRTFGAELRTAARAWASGSDYQVPAEVAAAHQTALAGQALDAALRANHMARDYLRLTVLFAGVAFLAGICTKFRYPGHVVIVVAGLIVFVIGGIGFVRVALEAQGT